MKTTVEIADELFRAAKTRAAEQGVPFRQVLDSALRTYLEQEPRGEFHLRDGSYGSGGLREGYSWETLLDHAYEDSES